MLGLDTDDLMLDPITVLMLDLIAVLMLGLDADVLMLALVTVLMLGLIAVLMLGLDADVLMLALVTVLMLGLDADVLRLGLTICEGEPVITKLLQILRYADNFLFIKSSEELSTYAIQLPWICPKIVATKKEGFVKHLESIVEDLLAWVPQLVC